MSFFIMSQIHVYLIFSYMARCGDTYIVNKKKNIEAPSTSLEYQNPAAKITDDEDDKKASAVENNYVIKLK